MSNESEWNQDQGYSERVLQKQLTEKEELRDLLSVFIDASVLKGFEVTKEQWNRACLLCGRYTKPFIREELRK